ncbi:hypothetical protein F4810DRAFT_388644 [Camillea tinctor]|nr:hypothetical protein F4810DRAFT_388644 [Camillea tinctor]
MSLCSVVPERRQPLKSSPWFGPPPSSGEGTPRSIPTIEPYIGESSESLSRLPSPEDVNLDDHPLPIPAYTGESAISLQEFPRSQSNCSPESSYTLPSYPLSTHRPSKRSCPKPNTREAQTSFSVLAHSPPNSHHQAPEMADTLSAPSAPSSGARLLPTIPRATVSRVNSASHTDGPVRNGHLRGAESTDQYNTNASRWEFKPCKFSGLRKLLGHIVLGALWITRLFTDWLTSPQRNWTQMNTIIALVTLIVTILAAIDPLEKFFRMQMVGGFQKTRTPSDYCDCSPLH